MENIHPIFGKNGERDFFYNIITSDSLKLVWKADAFGSFNNSSVVANDSMIFIADLAGRIHVFNLENGKQRGVLKTKGAIFSTPFLYKFRIYYPLVKDGKKLTEFIVYDYYAGKDLYIVEIEDLITNQMLFDDESIYLFAEDGTVYKYNYETKLIWKIETNQNIHSVPALTKNKIFIGNDTGEIVIIDTNTGKILDRKKISSHFFSGITINDGICYIGDDEGKLFAIDSDTYEIIFSVDTKGRILMNPAIDDKNIYVGNMKRMFFCIDKKNGKIIWSKNLKGYFNTTPIVTSNHLFVPNLFKSLFVLDKQSGEVIKEIEFDNRARLSLVIVKNKLIIGYDEGVIAAYEFVN
ncbi:MAG: PQQ-binding-like beta-propeller repeat protein [Ignavibacterium sp.]